MKRWGWVLSLPVCFGLWTCAWAEEAVLNNPPETVSKVQTVVNVLSPGFDELYDFRDGEWKSGVSASLYSFKSHDDFLGSVRLGYVNRGNIVYSSLLADLPGLSRRFVPATIRGIATTGYLDVLWAAIGKYGSVGTFAGYGFDEGAMSYGVTVGGQVTF